MKTTKKLFKTLLMSVMLVSCFGANAMAEETVSDEKGMEVKLNLDSTFTWDIPSELLVNQAALADKDFYETSFEISVNSVTLTSNEKVKVVISRESGTRYNSSEKKFFMTDSADLNNDTKLFYYIREAQGDTNIGINEELLGVSADDFVSNGAPVTKTLKMSMPCDSSLSYAGNYKSTLIFQASIVNQSA